MHLHCVPLQECLENDGPGKNEVCRMLFMCKLSIYVTPIYFPCHSLSLISRSIIICIASTTYLVKHKIIKVLKANKMNSASGSAKFNTGRMEKDERDAEKQAGIVTATNAAGAVGNETSSEQQNKRKRSRLTQGRRLKLRSLMQNGVPYETALKQCLEEGHGTLPCLLWGSNYHERHDGHGPLYFKHSEVSFQ